MTDAVHIHRHDHRHDQRPGHAGRHHHAPADFGRAFAVGIGLNAAYVIAEAGFGVFAHSLALLSDAGHNLGDVLALGLAFAAARMSRKAPSQRYTYGLGGSSILAALSNAMLLLVVTGGIAWAAILRLFHPEPAAGSVVMAVAAGGVAINVFTALMFASGRKGDVNIRAAFTHMAADALVAAGVVAAGGVMIVTGWLWLDPAVSLVIGLVIVAGTWSLLRESLDLALDAVPSGIDREAVRAYLAGLPGVAEVHDLHIWGMSTTDTALTAHLVRPGAELDDGLIQEACHDLQRRFGIQHATLQIERGVGEHPCHLADEAVI
ncbi:MAG TPA: cation diffusion facilitator family transporter [Caulobacteraceae bacterium]|jgi:cobalt-zinc-cadmium efflux system protein